MRKLLVILTIWALTSIACAHDLGISGIRFLFRESDTVISVTVKRSSLDSLVINGNLEKSDIDPIMRQIVKLRLDGKTFTPDKSTIIDDPTNDTVVWQITNPGTNDQYEVLERLFPQDPESKTVISIFRNGVADSEILLDKNNPAWLRTNAKSKSQNKFLTFISIGITHILSGADHILFVIGLILLGGSLKTKLKIVTAFTVAHTLTLAISTLGIFQPSPRIIEPLIALSITAIAFENLRKKPEENAKDYRSILAFTFGLIHGFGFAGAMAEVGAEGWLLATALVSFNIGVELGQATIILISTPLLLWLATKHPEKSAQLTKIGSILIGIVGIFWFVTRLMGA
ncbi:MAG: HupE/UreJ family protein [Fimbriimonadaceae bacterium]